MKTIEISKKAIFFEEKDATKFRAWLWINNLNYGEVAYRMGYSYTYVYMILNGKRAATPKFIKRLKKIGYEM